MIRFELIDVHDVPGQQLIVQQLPRLCRDRYSNISQSIFVRDCSGKLYTIISHLMYADLMNGVTLFNGVLGISKSLFLVYLFTDSRGTIDSKEFDLATIGISAQFRGDTISVHSSTWTLPLK